MLKLCCLEWFVGVWSKRSIMWILNIGLKKKNAVPDTLSLNPQGMYDGDGWGGEIYVRMTVSWIFITVFYKSILRFI